MRSAEDELAAIAELRTGSVRVAGFQSVLSTLVPRAAADMHTAFPGVELSLADMHPDEALERLREGLIDVAIVFRYDDAVPEGFRFERLSTTRCISSAKSPTRPSPASETPRGLLGAKTADAIWLAHAKPQDSLLASGTPVTTPSFSNPWLRRVWE